MKSFVKFLFSKKFWIQIVLAIVLIFVIFHVALWATGIYAHHGERIVVPDLSGMTSQEVGYVLTEKKLTSQVVDSMFDKNAAPGSVLEQFPRSGVEVKRNREIKLTIATTTPRKVVMEKVQDLSLRQAIAQFKKQGVVVADIEYVLSNYTHLVLGVKLGDKELKEGDEIYKGDEITLVVGYNEGDKFAMPNLYGLSEKYARLKAIEAGIGIGKVVCKNCDKKERKRATVSWQSVEAGEDVVAGGRVNILLVKQKKGKE